MQEHILSVFATMAWLLIIGTVFWLFSLLLPKPEEGKHENLRNFHCAHMPSLFNKESRIEWFYPLITALLTQPLIVITVYYSYEFMADKVPHQMFDTSIESLPFVVQVFLGLLVIDISVWIRHSFVHKYFWSFHAVHHCAKEISWLTTQRLHPVDHFLMSIIDFFVLYFIGFSAEGMAFAMVIKTLHNMYIHSNIVLDYPKPWKYIFVSPNMHRWHHATEKEAHDKNFCVIFAFVDYLLGTYYVPDNALPKEYGSGFADLDDVDSKSIVTELVLPFKLAVPASSADGAQTANLSDTTA